VSVIIQTVLAHPERIHRLCRIRIKREMWLLMENGCKMVFKIVHGCNAEWQGRQIYRMTVMKGIQSPDVLLARYECESKIHRWADQETGTTGQQRARKRQRGRERDKHYDTDKQTDRRRARPASDVGADGVLVIISSDTRDNRSRCHHCHC